MTNENIRTKEIIKFIADEVARGISWRGIARDIEVNFGIHSNYVTVKSVYNQYLSKGMESSDEIGKEASLQIVNIKDQLTKINKLTNDLLDKYRKLEAEDPDITNINVIIALMREIKEHIVIQQKLTERLIDAKKSVNVSNIYLTKVMVQNLHEWEKQGMVKIIKMPLSDSEEEEDKELEEEIEVTNEN